MAIYNFLCPKCKEEYEKIVKIGQEYDQCPKCKSISKRTHMDLPNPPKLIAGCGGFFKNSYGDRKRE